MVKTILTGDPALADEMFVKRARDLLVERDSPEYLEEKERIRKFINLVTSNVPVLMEIARLEGIFSDRRAEGYICLTATGLLIMAKVANELFTKTKLYPDWHGYARKLGSDIDWRKSGPLWQNTIINTGKSFSNKGPLNKAVEAVKRALNMQSLSATKSVSTDGDVAEKDYEPVA